MNAKDIEQAIRAQKLYCEFRMIPLFIPDDGYCYSCERNIFMDYETKGITQAVAGRTLITSCPHCHYSFVE